MDRLEQTQAVRDLAAGIVQGKGNDGDTKADFYEQAVAFSLPSASDVRRIWNETIGVDDHTGLPLA